MAWSMEQTHQIVEQFWQDGVVRCPDDAGPLKLKLHKLHGGDSNDNASTVDRSGGSSPSRSNDFDASHSQNGGYHGHRRQADITKLVLSL